MESLKDKILNIDKKILIAISIILMLFFISVMYFSYEYSNKDIHRGVKIEGIEVSNLNKDEALKKVKSETDKLISDYKVNFVTGEEEFKIPLKEFGYSLDLDKAIDEAYNYGRSNNIFKDYYQILKSLIAKENIIAATKIDNRATNEVVEDLGNKIFIKPKDANPVINEDKTVTISKESIGRYLDLNETKKLLNIDILKADKIELPVYKTEPAIYSDYYQGIDKVLGEFETDYSTSTNNRKENVKLSASKFDNLKLEPNQEISFNDQIGDITVEEGFKTATVIVSGEYESGVGGGVCQVSTTLYNSLILSDLEIVERHNHSRPISYVELGTDAAVVKGYKDLKFKNNTNHPILIVASADGKKLNFKVLGNSQDRDYEVKIIPERKGVISPQVKTKYSDKMYEGDSKVEQSGSRGYSYVTFKEIIKNGEVQNTTQISKSYYIPKDKIVVVGTKTSDSSSDKDNDED
ncbi:VanW family protein [Peptoniphilus sp. MSJ-1]|uniref:VanW family protein n=1 Tax=Peptoniphilus ovalis TaxID=2841503 RepID=A0ABS6FGU3_9FIRM|nr:VanW family protein [Peptoniphilus ovalis]MBU5669384.1 VanW family protein [Peptoniphilus ovalis]